MLEFTAKSCEKTVDPTCIGYKVQSNCYSIEERSSILCGICHNSKGKKSHYFLTFYNDSTKKQKVWLCMETRYFTL